MRNLKRVLSLALALVMVLGMMVIGTSAATFADAAEIDYPEAVDVMSAIGVLEGDGTNYNPDAVLTRAEATTIIARMLLGKENAAKLVGTGVYTDTVGHWAAGYIDYCDSLGILAGNGDGTFTPNGKLTGVAFAKMLLVALGYDAEIEGYVNNKNWATNITSDAITAGLDIKGIALANEVTREQAAQMAFQALTANMVKYSSKGTNITIGDTTVNSGASDALPYTGGTEYNEVTGAVTSDYLQFCEQYFPNLKKADGVDDIFGRPSSHIWYINNDRTLDYDSTGKDALAYNGTYAPVKVYTSNFNANTTKAYDFTGAAVVLNGPTNTDTPTTVANLLERGYAGTTIELYNTDNDKPIDKIVVIQGYLTEVTDVKTDATVASSNFIKLAVYNPWATGDVVNVTLNDNVDPEVVTVYDKLIAKYAKKDLLITYWTEGNPVLGFVAAEDVTAKTATVTAKKLDSALSGTIVAGGTTYTMASGYAEAAGVGGDLTLGQEYTLYFDANGYVFGAVPTKAAVSSNYLYVLAVDQKTTTSFGADSTSVQIQAMLADGTTGTYTVALESVNAGNAAAIEGRNPNATAGVAAGDFVLAGTETIVFKNASPDVESAESVLDGNVYGYLVGADGALTLQAKTAASSGMTIGGTYVDTVNSTTAGATVNGETLFTANTVYVVYNATTKTVATYTGSAVAKTYGTLATAKSVITATSTGAGAASVVFVENSNTQLAGAVATNEVYVDATSKTETLAANGKTTEFTFDAWNAAGEKITVKAATAASITSGLHVLKSDGTIADAAAIDCSTAGDQYVYDADAIVEAGMLKVDATTVYNMGKVVDLTRAQTGATSNATFKAVIVLEKLPSGTITSNASVIYIVD